MDKLKNYKEMAYRKVYGLLISDELRQLAADEFYAALQQLKKRDD